MGVSTQGRGQSSDAPQLIAGADKIPEHPARRSPHVPNYLDTERINASFNSRQLTHFLNGSPDVTLLRESIMLDFERDPTFKLSDFPTLTLPQIRERTMSKFGSMLHWLATEDIDKFNERMQVVSVIDPAFWTRFGVHIGLFFGALQGQATPSQLAHWAGKGAVVMNGIIGCFAMTELGHGSNVAGVETTATFDEETDEFIIHTPTLTATKWWIGGAAQSATHCACIAQLVVKGKRYGPKSFVVQLRDPGSYRLMPGVTIGDIGKKMGRDGIDNGWIQFTHVRVPRSNMLMKHAQVSREGKVSLPAMEQLTYGPLIKGRVAMVVDSAASLMKALTIAVRYACVRKQFSLRPGEPETKIMNYVIHQHRLIPLVAKAFALHFAGQILFDAYKELMASMENVKPGDANMKQILEKLKEVHSTSAGLKAFGTWACLGGIDTCRQACGGHGYSAYVGLSQQYADFAVQCSWEGDNTILALQTGRYLVQCFREIHVKKRQVNGLGVAYLNKAQELKSKRAAGDITDLESMKVAWDAVCARQVEIAGKLFLESMEKGMDLEGAMEVCASERMSAARMHCLGTLYRSFFAEVDKAPAQLRPIVGKICQLNGLASIQENAGPFLQCGYYDAAQMDRIAVEVTRLCGELRPEIISLVDSFGWTDYVVNSPLGRYDGNAYESYFGLVSGQNPVGQVPSYFGQMIHPVLTRNMEKEEGPELE